MYDTNTAVIGAGFIGPVHVEALQRAGVNVIGILGVDDAETQIAAEALGLSKAHTGLDELLADDAVHAVHIAVPNKLHYDMARKALSFRTRRTARFN